MRFLLMTVGVMVLGMVFLSNTSLVSSAPDLVAPKNYSNVVSLNNLDDLLPHLSSGDPMEVRVTVWRISTIQDSRVPEILLKLWSGDSQQSLVSAPSILDDPNVRLAVAEGLIYHGAGNVSEYEEYIYKNIHDEQVKVRSNAASALGSIGDNDAVNALAKLISKDHVFVALNAVSALKKIIIENRPGKEKALEVMEHLAENIGDVSQPILKAEIEKAYSMSKKAVKRQEKRIYSNQQLGGAQSSDDFKKGELLFLSGDHVKALQLLLPYAERGIAEAQFYVGEIYSVGIGVEHDYVAAAKWLLLAAKQGNAAAQFSLANMYVAGDGVEKNYQEAIKWLTQSAEQGYANAQDLLGEAFQGGWWGLPQDSVKARYWFDKAESGR